MAAVEMSARAHGWPVFQTKQQLDLGRHFEWSGGGISLDLSAGAEALARQGIGTWECDLEDSNALTWSPLVYDLFGFKQGDVVRRKKTIVLYREDSRVKLERLRAYAIKHRRGFTLDAEIVPANGGRRWIRLIAAPVCVDNRTVRLSGFKSDVTHEYR
jgi:PAS domain S-box-containing protein